MIPPRALTLALPILILGGCVGPARPAPTSSRPGAPMDPCSLGVTEPPAPEGWVLDAVPDGATRLTWLRGRGPSAAAVARLDVVAAAGQGFDAYVAEWADDDPNIRVVDRAATLGGRPAVRLAGHIPPAGVRGDVPPAAAFLAEHAGHFYALVLDVSPLRPPEPNFDAIVAGLRFVERPGRPVCLRYDRPRDLGMTYVPPPGFRYVGAHPTGEAHEARDVRPGVPWDRAPVLARLSVQVIGRWNDIRVWDERIVRDDAPAGPVTWTDFRGAPGVRARHSNTWRRNREATGEPSGWSWWAVVRGHGRGGGPGAAVAFQLDVSGGVAPAPYVDAVKATLASLQPEECCPLVSSSPRSGAPLRSFPCAAPGAQAGAGQPSVLRSVRQLTKGNRRKKRAADGGIRG